MRGYTHPHTRCSTVIAASLAAIVLVLLLAPVALAESPDISTGPPGVVVPASPVSGSLAAGDDADLYSVQLIGGQTISATLVSGDPWYAQLELRRSGGEWIAETTFGVTTISYTVPSGDGQATYFLRMEHLTSTAVPVDYEFSYTISPSAPTTGDISVSATVALPTALTFTISGLTAPSGGSVSETAIDFGPLTPGVPKTGSHRLSVTTNSDTGYKVWASENRPLTSGLHTIPDFAGDAGTVTDPATTGPWALATTYGFGYTLSGADAAFTSDYRQFANTTGGEYAQSIMSSSTPVTGSEVDVAYKVNISAGQHNGTYTNTLTYIATGNF